MGQYQSWFLHSKLKPIPDRYKQGVIVAQNSHEYPNRDLAISHNVPFK